MDTCYICGKTGEIRKYFSDAAALCNEDYIEILEDIILDAQETFHGSDADDFFEKHKIKLEPIPVPVEIEVARKSQKTRPSLFIKMKR